MNNIYKSNRFYCLLVPARFKRVLMIMLLCSFSVNIIAQEGQASLLLDLKKSRSAFEMAKEKYENNKDLLENKAISEAEFNQSKNEFLSAEVDYQKLILKLISEQSYVIVEKAIKYQTKSGERRVKIILRSTMEGNQEYLKQFEQHFDVFTSEMRSNKIYNVFVSLENMTDKIIIGSPYKIRIPSIELGKTAIADFKLLKDIESVQVTLKYDGGNDYMNVLLEKDASANIVDIVSTQFSQEVDLGSSATFDLTLERFSTSDDVYQLLVLNLPRQISADFLDSETNARLSQLKFNQGVNIRNLSLKTFLPDREGEGIEIDVPIKFYAAILSRKEYDKLYKEENGDLNLSQDKIDKLQGNKIKLELIPRGIGKIEVIATNLYHEILVDDSVNMQVLIRNIGTRGLNNVKVTTDYPNGWNSIIEPNIINTLNAEDEQDVRITIIPPKDVSVGVQEFKIKTEAMVDNNSIYAEDKIIRVKIETKTAVLWIIFLVLILLGVIIGIVVFGIRISRS